MKVLILGGTIFLGRHLTEALLFRGHDVTHFNRGLTNSYLFPEVEKLRGDRNCDLFPMLGRSWDAVVDTCGYFPRQVVEAAKALHQHTPLYVFVSSVNQYADLSISSVDESHHGAAFGSQAEQIDTPLTPETYGPLKSACEIAVRQVYGDGALVVRAGCLVGPCDQSHRFSYWVRRSAAGGPMLVPGRPDQFWQIVDVRDAAGWIVHMLEEGRTGTFNVVGPEQPITAVRLVKELASVAGINAQPIWVDTGFLRAEPSGKRWLDLAEWSDLPPTMAHLYSIDNAHAIASGLCFRPLAVSARDVLCWLAQREHQEADGLEPERENDLLRIWERFAATMPC